MIQPLKEKHLQLIEDELEKIFEPHLLTSQLREASVHSLFPAGKRIRPLIALSIVHDCGGDLNQAAPIMIALELIHCASLIHDDLPSLDNDDYRRGKLSCHKQFGEGVAVLTGDALVGVAFHTIATADIPTELQALLLRSLSKAFIELCNGQELDIAEEGKRPKIEIIHQKKTGALFGATFEFGCRLADVSDESIIEIAIKTGEKFGLYFQILDDYLDIYGDPGSRGRPAGSDKKNNKQTFASELSKEEFVHKIRDIRNDFEDSFSQFVNMLREEGIQFPLTGSATWEVISSYLTIAE